MPEGCVDGGGALMNACGANALGFSVIDAFLRRRKKKNSPTSMPTTARIPMTIPAIAPPPKPLFGLEL